MILDISLMMRYRLFLCSFLFPGRVDGNFIYPWDEAPTIASIVSLKNRRKTIYRRSIPKSKIDQISKTLALREELLVQYYYHFKMICLMRIAATSWQRPLIRLKITWGHPLEKVVQVKERKEIADSVEYWKDSPKPLCWFPRLRGHWWL